MSYMEAPFNASKFKAMPQIAYLPNFAKISGNFHNLGQIILPDIVLAKNFRSHYFACSCTFLNELISILEMRIIRNRVIKS